MNLPQFKYWDSFDWAMCAVFVVLAFLVGLLIFAVLMDCVFAASYYSSPSIRTPMPIIIPMPIPVGGSSSSGC